MSRACGTIGGAPIGVIDVYWLPPAEALLVALAVVILYYIILYYIILYYTILYYIILYYMFVEYGRVELELLSPRRGSAEYDRVKASSE